MSIANKWQRSHFRRIHRNEVDADKAHIGILECATRGGGEIGHACADGDDEVGALLHRRLNRRDLETAYAPHRDGRSAGLIEGDRDVGGVGLRDDHGG